MIEKNIGISLSKEQDEHLERIAKAMQNSKSGVVRYLIEEHMKDYERSS